MYTVKFYGREKGSIGVCSHFVLTVYCEYEYILDEIYKIYNHVLDVQVCLNDQWIKLNRDTQKWK